MSEFSGKFDVADWFSKYSEEDIPNVSVYLEDTAIPLRIDSRKDLIPYYPNLVWFGSGNMVRISHRSYVDTEEEDFLSWFRDDIIKIYRKYKRKKKEFIPREVAEIVSISMYSYKQILEIANRIAKDGEKATIDGIHLEMQEIYRKRLYEEMVNAGYTEEYSKWWIWKDWNYDGLNK